MHIDILNYIIKCTYMHTCTASIVPCAVLLTCPLVSGLSPHFCSEAKANRLRSRPIGFPKSQVYSGPAKHARGVIRADKSHDTRGDLSAEPSATKPCLPIWSNEAFLIHQTSLEVALSEQIEEDVFYCDHTNTRHSSSPGSKVDEEGCLPSQGHLCRRIRGR